MIIFADNTDASPRVIALLDRASSDDTFSKSEIKRFAAQVSKHTEIEDVTLNYSFTYTHSARQLGGALKTRLSVEIENPTIELVRLLNVSIYTSQENVETIASVARDVADPQLRFPVALIVQRLPDSDEVLTRKVIITSAQFNATQRRTYNVLRLSGGAYDSAVMRLNFSLNIDAKKPLFEQVRSAMSERFTVLTDSIPDAASIKPRVSRYYPPAVADVIFNELCLDNNLAFSIQDDKVTFVKLAPDTPPQTITKPKQFCFAARVKDAALMQDFTFENYTNARWVSAIYDAKLFDIAIVWDDTRGSDEMKKAMFANLNKATDKPAMIGYQKPVDGYRFWIVEYELRRSATQLQCTTTAANNWLLANIKLDSILDAAVFTKRESV